MKKLHLICNAHLDPVWQWTSDEGIAAAIATFQSAADLADEFDYIFCHNEAFLYEAIEHYAPSLFERIKNLVRQGKWQIIGGWYIQPDCNMPSGESLVRQIKIGQAYFREKFGTTPTTACNFDSFGHSVGLVQILKKCGYDSYLITRPSEASFHYPGRFFEWVGNDASVITVGRVGSYASAMGQVVKKIQNHLQSAEDTDYVLWGVGNHGGGPSRRDLTQLKNLQIPDVQIMHSTPERLFADNIKISGRVNTSLITSMPGCYTSMHKIKQAHRDAENMLYFAEKIMSVAALSGCTFDDIEFNAAQKQFLLAEFHDILPGSSVTEGEKEGLELLSSASQVFRKNRTKAFLHLVMGEPKAEPGEYPIFVFNPMPYEITYPVEAEFTLADQNWDTATENIANVFQDGKALAVQQIKENSTINLDWRKRIIFEGKLKPLGVTRFSVKTQLQKKSAVKNRRTSLQTLLDGQSLLKAPAQLIMYDDTADPWGMSDNELKQLGKNPVCFEKMTKEQAQTFCAAKAVLPEEITEDGDILTAVEVFYQKDNTRAQMEYRFYKNQPYIDINVNLEFADKNKLVRLQLDLGGGDFVGDAPYATERKGDTEVNFQKWVGIQENDGITAVINNGIYGGKRQNGKIELTLIRGTGYLFHPIGDLPLYPENRYLPRIDSGRYLYRFRIMKGSMLAVQNHADLFNAPPFAVNAFPVNSGKMHAEIFTDRPVNMPVCKYENQTLTMRFYNPEPNEKEFVLTVQGNSVRVNHFPFEVVSVIYHFGTFEIVHDTMPL